MKDIKEMIKFEKVTATYKNGSGIFDINFSMNKSEMIFLMGPTGSGKSTLLKTIYKELDIDAGEIYIDGEEISLLKNSRVPFLRRDIGMIFQDFRLLNDRTVFDNVSLPLRIQLCSKDEIKDKTFDIIDAVGLSGKEKSYPDELSGGEQQRVSLARSLATSPKLLLLDEPFSSLDKSHRDQLVKEVRVILKKAGVTSILVTHDEAEANTFADKIGKIEKKQLLIS